MVEEKTIKPILLNTKQTDTSLRNKNNLKFFLERSSETVERTLNIVQKLQHEINLLKEGLSKADNEFYNFKDFSEEGSQESKNEKFTTET